jgi:hypothetical protein
VGRREEVTARAMRPRRRGWNEPGCGERERRRPDGLKKRTGNRFKNGRSLGANDQSRKKVEAAREVRAKPGSPVKA